MDPKSIIATYKEIITKKYFCFEGTASRGEFVQFFVVNFVVGLILSIIDSLIGIRILSSLYGLAILLPFLGLGCRRLHDIGKSGWLQLIFLIPIVQLVLLIYMLIKEGKNPDQPSLNA